MQVGVGVDGPAEAEDLVLHPVEPAVLLRRHQQQTLARLGEHVDHVAISGPPLLDDLRDEVDCRARNPGPEQPVQQATLGTCVHSRIGQGGTQGALTTEQTGEGQQGLTIGGQSIGIGGVEAGVHGLPYRCP